MNKDFGKSNDEKKVFKTRRSCKSIEKVLLRHSRNSSITNKKGSFFNFFEFSRTRNSYEAELFLRSLVKLRGRRVVYTDGALFYIEACRSLSLVHRTNRKRSTKG